MAVKDVVEQLDRLIEERTSAVKSSKNDDRALFELGRAYLSKAFLWDKSKTHNEETCYQLAIDNFEKAHKLMPTESEYPIYGGFALLAKSLYDLD
jgi:hypothetical protein